MIKLKQILTEGMGDCYQAAGRLIMEYIGKGKLVHGMVNGQGSLEGIRFGHAWVEVGSKVLDHSNSKKKSIQKNVNTTNTKMQLSLWLAKGIGDHGKCRVV
mgnify:CR=1 FL=1